MKKRIKVEADDIIQNKWVVDRNAEIKDWYIYKKRFKLICTIFPEKIDGVPCIELPEEESLLDEIDSVLASMEDYLHGKQGMKVSKLRGKIQAAQSPKPIEELILDVDGDKVEVVSVKYKS